MVLLDRRDLPERMVQPDLPDQRERQEPMVRPDLPDLQVPQGPTELQGPQDLPALMVL